MPTPCNYPPQAALLDFVKAQLEVRTDAALCRELSLAPPIVSKLRKGRATVSARSLLAMHLKSGVPVDVLTTYIAQ